MTKNSEISLDVDNHNIRIAFKEEYRNDTWAKDFGRIQNLLKECVSKEITITIFFHETVWIDPLPLLSFLLSIAELEKPQIEIHLPPLNNNSKKFLAFISTEGFIQQLLKSNVKFVSCGRAISNVDLKEYEHYVGELIYANCRIIKALVVELEEEIYGTDLSIDTWVNELIQQSRYSIKNKVENYIADQITNRLHRLLTELLSNVYEHAYKDKSKKYVGIYVRFREGLSNNHISNTHRKALSKAIGNEHRHSPTLIKYFVESVFNFIEVFVIDSGCGLADSYKPYFKKKKYKYPFQEAWKMAILNGKRGANSKNKRTQFGGLYSITKYLGHNFICGISDNEWIGHSLPIRFKLQPPYERVYPEQKVNGLGFIFRITWDVASDDEISWERVKRIENDAFSNNSLEMHPLYEELCVSVNSYQRFSNIKQTILNKIKGFYVEDERFETSNETCRKIYDKKETTYDFCFFLPKRILQKNDIIDSIIKRFGSINCNTRCLIIGDILVNEANLYQLALENATFSENFLNSFDTIILLSQRFAVLVLKKDIINKTYVMSKRMTHGYINSRCKEFCPQKNLRNFISWLKTHDSLLFWLLVRAKNDKNRHYYINANINWKSEDAKYEMIGYLNFSQVTSDIELKRIFDNALMRTLCLSSKSGIDYQNIDVLTSKLCTEMNSLFFNMKETDDQILLGSVRVTGYSEYSAAPLKAEISRIPIHFFLHGAINKIDPINGESATVDISPHLFFWPTEWLDQNFEKISGAFKRVGNSHVIAPSGSKYYPIPRYRIKSTNNNGKTEYLYNYSEVEENNKIEYELAYERCPKDTYDDFQITGRQNLQIGHFQYGKYHDLFKFDFSLLVNDSFNEGGKLAVFLLTEFLLALGSGIKGFVDHIPDFSRKRIIEKTKLTETLLENAHQFFLRDIQNNLESAKPEECALIIYPSHYNNENIIGIVKRFIRNDLHSKIISLVPIKAKRQSSAYLISPIILNSIKNKILSYKQKHKTNDAKVLLFDNVTVDGKTREELKHLLFYLGASQVKTLCILDRRRLPLVPTKPDRDKVFWRIDLPRLGDKGNCLLCKSIQSLRNFQTDLVYSLDKNRVNQWELSWKNQYPFSKKAIHGLEAKTLLDKISKKFSIIMDLSNDKKMHWDNINIYTSLGLSLYVSEICSMTGRDDMALAICNDKKIPILCRIEMLSVNLLLFGSEFSKLMKLQMIQRIVKEINSTSDVSNETSLGILSILSQPDDIVESVLLELVSSIKSEKDLKNYDLELLMAFFAQNDNSSLSKIDWLNSHFTSAFSSNVQSFYYQFHHEQHNIYGNAHNKPMKVFLKVDKYSVIKLEDINDAIKSSDKLTEMVSLFPRRNLRNDDLRDEIKEIFDYGTKVRKFLVTFLQECKDFLTNNHSHCHHCKSKSNVDCHKIKEKCIKYHCSYVCGKKDLVLSLRRCQHFIDEYQKKLFSLHSNIFIQIGIQTPNIFPLKKCLTHLIDKHNASQNNSNKVRLLELTKPDKSEGEIWIPFDALIERKIEFILNNAKYAHESISSTGEIELSKTESLIFMNVSVSYEERSVLINFDNFSYQSGKEITDKASLKRKPERIHIEDLGGHIGYKTTSLKNDSIKKLTTTLELKSM